MQLVPQCRLGARLFILTLVLGAFVACSKKTAFLTDSTLPEMSLNAGDVENIPPSVLSGTTVVVPDCWLPLAQKLANDGLQGPEVNALLASLGAQPTQSPMGRKIRELYNSQILQKKKKTKPLKHYKGVVTKDNARLCCDFIEANKVAFVNAEQQYGVPPSVAVSLLFVETRLGKVLGDVPENAFYTLASMAVSRSPEAISSWLEKLPGYEQHREWLMLTMNKRADWAYAEVRALVRHMLRDNISPQDLPGSIYGAVGLCQFMPSNISIYGDDGNGDGKVDLFTVPDAVASLAKYLGKHGWRQGLSYKQQHKVLMTYNHSKTYANTILDLAQLVSTLANNGVPCTGKATKRHG